MQLPPRENLRHDVRAIVHRACWRRFEGDGAGADALLANGLADLLNAPGAAAPPDDVLNAWLAEDRGDFDRAMMIGELVARRLTGAAPVAAFTSASEGARPAARIQGRAPRADAPAIADLLDDMLAQDRRVRATG